MADRAGFDEFVVARSPRLLRVAYLLTRDWAQAEDVLQTALMKAWFAWSRLDGEPEAYVRKIIATTYVSWRRRRWTAESVRAELPEPPPHDGTSAIDDRYGLWTALGRLPARQRAVLVLRFYEDMTEQQVAAALGVSVGTVKSQSSKALQKLRADSAFAGSNEAGRWSTTGRPGDESDDHTTSPEDTTCPEQTTSSEHTTSAERG